MGAEGFSAAASGEPVAFGFPDTFEPFSPERLFTPVGSTLLTVTSTIRPIPQRRR